MLHRTSIFAAAILSVASWTIPSDARAQSSSPLPQAHAHNDYLHERPLLDALSHGFCSVEADIFLVDGELLVAHSRSELSPERTLRRLYLDPLRARVKENKGSVYGEGSRVTLLIDFKADGEETYRALDQLLAEYADVFSMVRTSADGKSVMEPGPVTAIVSGDRPVDLIAEDKTRFVGIDGRLTDLETELPVHLLPLISDNWGQHFRWRGKGEMSSEDREKLDAIVKQVHAKGRRLRFWAIPDNAAAWELLSEAGVDMVNTDKLAELSQFLRSEER